MQPEFRIVWNEALDETIVSGIVKNLDAKMNGEAGQLLYSFDCDLITYDDLKKEYFDFLKECENYEFIKNQKPNFALTKVSHEYPLKRIQIELSLLCNLACSYCYSTSGPHRTAKLTSEKVVELINEAYDLGCIWLDFTGGEPLAYKDWDKVISHAVNKGLVCSLHTNGVLLNAKNVERLKTIGVRHIQTSLDSHIADVHDEARGRKGAFEKTIEGIKRAQDLGIPIKVSIVAHKKNHNHFAEAVTYFREGLGTRVLMDRVIKTGGELDANMGLSTKEYFDLIRPIIREGVADSKVCDNFVVNDFKVEPHCGVAHSFVYITAQGEFALCPTMTTRDNRELFNSPTIENCTLTEAWLYSDYMNEYRGLNCRNTSKCPAARTCGGGCRSNAYFETGELDSPDFLSCNAFKNFSEEYMDFKKIYQGKSA